MKHLGALIADDTAFAVTAEPFTHKDRRQSFREPVNDLSEISSDPAQDANGCVIHNISKGGALIEVSTREVPKRFILTNHTRQTRAICEQVWMCGSLMGVRFLTPERQFTF